MHFKTESIHVTSLIEKDKKTKTKKTNEKHLFPKKKKKNEKVNDFKIF